MRRFECWRYLPRGRVGGADDWGSVCTNVDPITLEGWNDVKLTEDVVTVRSEVGDSNYCIRRADLIASMRANPVYKWLPSRASNPQFGRPDTSVVFYKHPDLGVWIDGAGMRLLEQTTPRVYSLFQLEFVGKERVGTEVAISAIHGSIVDVYTLVPLASRAGYLAQVKRGFVASYRRESFARRARVRQSASRRRRAAPAEQQPPMEQEQRVLARWSRERENPPLTPASFEGPNAPRHLEELSFDLQPGITFEFLGAFDRNQRITLASPNGSPHDLTWDQSAEQWRHTSGSLYTLRRQDPARAPRPRSRSYNPSPSRSPRRRSRSISRSPTIQNSPRRLQNSPRALPNPAPAVPRAPPISGLGVSPLSFARGGAITPASFRGRVATRPTVGQVLIMDVIGSVRGLQVAFRSFRKGHRVRAPRDHPRDEINTLPEISVSVGTDSLLILKWQRGQNLWFNANNRYYISEAIPR
jgi:hypothetical protein